MDRQEGYYWVKRFDRKKHEIAFYTVIHGSPIWSLLSDDFLFDDTNFEHINEVRIKEPGELPD